MPAVPARPGARLHPGSEEETKAMSDFHRNAAARGGFADRAAIDAGLRAYMLRVYNYMAAAVALTGVVSLLCFQAAGGDAITISGGAIAGLTPFGQIILGGYTPMILMLGTLGLVFFISFRINTLQYTTALGLFMLYAGLLGAALTTIFVVYTGASITRVFFISAASFGALSLYGYTTQRDLSAMGSFLIMGLFGLILASLVNLIWPSGALSFAISVIGVGIFAGLTAYDTQRIKEMYDSMDDDGTLGRKAVMGALSLYLDFINLFLMLLRLVGDRR
jgi:FtsH-binding integral membrane protein